MQNGLYKRRIISLENMGHDERSAKCSIALCGSSIVPREGIEQQDDGQLVGKRCRVVFMVFI